MLKGIDISKWQAGIDLSKIDTDFVICKATEGVGYTDKNCDGFYQQAKCLGKKLGVYHFARPDLGNSAVEEADYFIKETKGYHKEAILILDWEPQGNSIANTGWAKGWLDRVYEKTGVKPLIYMSASVVRAYDWSKVVAGDYGLWIANYGSNNGTAQKGVFNNYPLRYWSFYALWQYTSKGRLSGYNGNLDLNYFSGDKTAWDKYAGGKPSTSTSTSKPLEKSVEELAKEVIAGKYGNGDARKKALGTRYDEVQARVNKILGVNNKVYYTVQKNDNLTKIAKKYGTTVNQLVAWNNIANPNLIYIGQKLRVK
jgi:GH25 family lysozyme M1 (1,4-beta-N-acetylmuramidase)/LysM repeat protein